MKLQPPKTPPHADLVNTPHALARTIVEYYKPFGHALDPCRGKCLPNEDGYPLYPFYDAMRLLENGPRTVDWCEIEEDRDFFACPDLEHLQYDWIITNPPWSKLRAFLNRSMQIADHVVFLVTLNHYFTKARYRDVIQAGFGFHDALLIPTPPAPWPGSGFQLAAVHVARGWRGYFNINDSLLHIR